MIKPLPKDETMPFSPKCMDKVHEMCKGSLTCGILIYQCQCQCHEVEHD